MDQPRPLAPAIAQVSLGVLVQVLAISCWFATAAALPSITADFGLDNTQRVLLIAGVQAGFAVGAVAVGLTRLTDRLPPALLVPLGAAATAGATLLPLTNDTSFAVLLASRVLVGLTLACVYPTGMRATVSWANPRWRGLAVAGVVAALTVGTAAPHLLEPTPIADWRHVLLVCAGAAVLAALLGLRLRTGPYAGAAPARRRASGAVRGGFPLRSAGQRRITLAYIGHMWEVYGLWVWLPALLAALPAVTGDGSAPFLGPGLLSFLIIGAVGAAGCLAGGLLASRFGKRLTARWAVAISAVCALATPVLPLLPAAAAIAILALWSVSAIADSPLYSALTGDEAEQGQLGSAIAIQMGLGYLLSIGAIYGVSAIGEAAGWRYAFLILALGPILSLCALRPARRHRA